MPDIDAFPPSKDPLHRLRHSGWSTGETAWRGADGAEVVQVDGRNGENRILARRSNAREAWHRAVEAVATVGMLEGWPRSQEKGYRPDWCKNIL